MVITATHSHAIETRHRVTPDYVGITVIIDEHGHLAVERPART
jgi:hypothetical protein